jgi:hypothetical protein
MAKQPFGPRALAFSVQILALHRRLRPQHERFGGALNQLVRAGTGIGANIEEGLSGISCVGHSMRSSYVPETQSPDA